jgi:hypothetical protein
VAFYARIFYFLLRLNPQIVTYAAALAMGFIPTHACDLACLDIQDVRRPPTKRATIIAISQQLSCVGMSVSPFLAGFTGSQGVKSIANERPVSSRHRLYDE